MYLCFQRTEKILWVFEEGPTKIVVATRDDIQTLFSWHCLQRMKESWCFEKLTENTEEKKPVSAYNKNK